MVCVELWLSVRSPIPSAMGRGRHFGRTHPEIRFFDLINIFVELLEGEPIILIDFKHSQEHVVDRIIILLVFLSNLEEFGKQWLQFQLIWWIVEHLLFKLMISKHHLNQDHPQCKNIWFLVGMLGDPTTFREGYHLLGGKKHSVGIIFIHELSIGPIYRFFSNNSPSACICYSSIANANVMLDAHLAYSIYDL